MSRVYRRTTEITARRIVGARSSRRPRRAAKRAMQSYVRI